MKSLTYLIVMGAFAALLVGCASSVPPPELNNARQSYQRASAGQAAQLAPAELHTAQLALNVAERSFQDDPTSYRTRDLAYIADRKAMLAEAIAATVAGNAVTAKANKDYQTTQTAIVKSTKEDAAVAAEQLAASERSNAVAAEQLAASERSNALAAEQLAAEQKARLDAETRAANAQADLAKLAAVKEEARGLVITLSGSVLFASNQSTLLPAAQNRLNQVADALMETKERRLTVEGHTDSQGSSSYNQELGQKRADAVRSYIIARGYSGDLIQAQGIGEERPVADNTSPEGRANNRRVEIIVERPSK
jgi:outer membrane protein OmpA-like peptidoglycan-associated protein